MPNFPTTAFAEFYSRVQEIRDSVLGQNLYDTRTYHSSNDARHLFQALEKLNNTVENIRVEYGIQGPNAGWNPRVLARNGAYSNPNGQTPPHNPSSQPQGSAHGSEINELREQAEKRNEELDQAKFKLDQLRQETSDANETIESLRHQLASEHKANKKFDLAAEQFDSLSRIKSKEMTEKKLKKDKPGARAAEESQLQYTHQKGETLLQAARYAEAEHALRHVLLRRKKIHNDDRLKRQENREAQLQLCTALRSQRQEDKTKEAEDLYYREASLANLETQYEADSTWAIRNAFEIVCVNAEQALYNNAISQLQRVWPVRGRASLECRRYLETELIRLWRLLEQRRVSHATSVLMIACEGQDGLPLGLLDYVSEQGKLLQERGEHKKAIFFLRKTWETPSLTPSQRLSSGWSYAWSLCHLKQFPEARGTLESILHLSKAKTSPSEYEIRALLAYAHLQSKNLTEAENNARIVFKKHGTTTLSGSHTFNQANTLIQALVKHNIKEQYKEAHKIWQQIYSDRGQIVLKAQGKEQLKSHAEVGKELATSWKRSAASRGINNPTSPRNIREEAKEIEDMAA